MCIILFYEKIFFNFFLQKQTFTGTILNGEKSCDYIDFQDGEQVRSSNVYEVSYTILVADIDAMIHEYAVNSFNFKCCNL